mmetsp:Transcript_1103/g.4067  ORF Transcript_1103/g.4067 Transcript_1103/m.4067 type:complete len:173 (+) Transcript_1103:146-664(+)
MPRDKTTTRRQALEREIEADGMAKPRSKAKMTKKRDRTADEEDYLPDALSTKILQEAKELREEVEAETSDEDEADDARRSGKATKSEHRVSLGRTLKGSAKTLIDDSYGSDDDDDMDGGGGGGGGGFSVLTGVRFVAIGAVRRVRLENWCRYILRNVSLSQIFLEQVPFIIQ